MKNRFYITGVLIVLVVFLIYMAIGAAGYPEHVTILYTSDELGFVNPCG